MARFRQGRYVPKNPDKYVGDVEKIRYMSSWELKTHMFLDNNPNILRWASEEVVIKYINPLDEKMHRYFVDYWIEYKDTTGKICHDLIEVKPKKQTKASRAKNPRSKLYENATYAVNLAKWEAAKVYAAKRGWRFVIWTEGQIFK